MKKFKITTVVFCFLIAFGWHPNSFSKENPKVNNKPEINTVVALKVSSRIEGAGPRGESLGPEGLLEGKAPGWHAAAPAKYPQEILVEYSKLRKISNIGLLAQEGQPARAPKAFKLELSPDGKKWSAVADVNDACASNMPGGWFNTNLAKPAQGKFIKLTIYSNCGDKQLLTLQGLRFGGE